jgi:hypothetical protein
MNLVVVTDNQFTTGHTNNSVSRTTWLSRAPASMYPKNLHRQNMCRFANSLLPHQPARAQYSTCMPISCLSGMVSTKISSAAIELQSECCVSPSPRPTLEDQHRDTKVSKHRPASQSPCTDAVNVSCVCAFLLTKLPGYALLLVALYVHATSSPS